MKFIDDLIADVKHAPRMLWRSPGFALTAIAALALGIGANTAIFSVVNAVLLAPLAYPHADRLVQLQNTFPQGSSPVASIPNFNVWRQQTQVFDAVAAYDFSGPGINLTGNGSP
jgi:putative ABC transport system permease protein